MEDRLNRIEAGIEKLMEAQVKTDAQLAITDLQIKELKLAQTKTDAQLAKTDAQLAKTDAQLAKTDAQLAKTDIRLNKLAKLIGNIGETDGKIAEQKIFYGLKQYLQIGDIKFDNIYKNLRPIGDTGPEFDILLVNGDSVCIVEVKKNVNIRDVDEILEKSISSFKQYYPQYAQYKMYFAIVSLYIYEDLVEKSSEKGIFLLTEQNDVMEIVNERAVAF